jgi:hypothetical protein
MTEAILDVFTPESEYLANLLFYRGISQLAAGFHLVLSTLAPEASSAG